MDNIFSFLNNQERNYIFMEIRQLEYFRAIVDAGTISGAARVLHMTQPPLSYQMKMLEEELQVSLFLRGTKKITLTDAGKTLYEQAGNLLMLADLTKQEVVKSGQAATLHIGITPSTVSMMSEYLLYFAKKYPQIHFDAKGKHILYMSRIDDGGPFFTEALFRCSRSLCTFFYNFNLNGFYTVTIAFGSGSLSILGPSHPAEILRMDTVIDIISFFHFFCQSDFYSF